MISWVQNTYEDANDDRETIDGARYCLCIDHLIAFNHIYMCLMVYGHDHSREKSQNNFETCVAYCSFIDFLGYEYDTFIFAIERVF